MKHLMMFVLVFVTSSAFAGESALLKTFMHSELVTDTLSSIEREHRVVCDDGSRVSAFLPKLFKKVKLTAVCGEIKVKLVASFKNEKNPIFTIVRLKVWDNKEDKENGVIFSSDPFIEAYKKSSVVRDIRHFVEDTYKVICNKGRAKRGTMAGKGNYFYYAKCSSDTVKIKVKIKSKVKIYGENVFKFDLTKYKLRFRK